MSSTDSAKNSWIKKVFIMVSENHQQGSTGKKVEPYVEAIAVGADLLFRSARSRRYSKSTQVAPASADSTQRSTHCTPATPA